MDKAAFFSAAKRAESTHTVEGFGDVRLQALTLGQRSELPSRFDEDAAETLVWVVCIGLVDFDDTDADDVRRMDATVLQSLADAILKLSGLSDEATGEAKND